MVLFLIAAALLLPLAAFLGGRSKRLKLLAQNGKALPKAAQAISLLVMITQGTELLRMLPQITPAHLTTACFLLAILWAGKAGTKPDELA
ncbi:MAG TPA: hypothetical protein VHA30_04530 [Patescibacteria group bacterium]|nr:hypothetical protein [Patescibacteria group bacterium]